MNPAWARAIAAIESSGGNYGLMGPVTRTGDRAYGKYQVMGANVPEWSQAALGRSMTPEEFLKDNDAQEKIFEHRFGGYVDKYGSPQEAASRWFTGRSMTEGANKRDVLGTTGLGYVNRFNKELSGPEAINTAIGNSEEGGGSAMPFADTSAPQGFLAGGPGAWFGMPNGMTSGGYDLGGSIMGAGAGLQSIDNPRGAAATAQLMASNRKDVAKQKDGDFSYDAKSGTFYRTRANGMLETTKNPNASDEPDKPKLTEKAIQNVAENVEKYGTIAQISKEGSDVLDDLQTGKLDLGVFKNWLNSGRNMAGVSDEQSRSFARWQQFLQKVSNDNLLLNKGVQTEGDAYREMKAIGAGGASYDNEAAKEALKKLLSRNEEAVLQRGRSTIDTHRQVYGDAPFATYTQQADRWNDNFANIRKRIEGYSTPQHPTTAPTAAMGSGGFKVIKSPY